MEDDILKFERTEQDGIICYESALWVIEKTGPADYFCYNKQIDTNKVREGHGETKEDAIYDYIYHLNAYLERVAEEIHDVIYDLEIILNDIHLNEQETE